MEVIAYFIISMLASVAGAICGIGGGVIIKPTLDLFHLDSVSTISFLSGCTVLGMTCYSVGKSMIARDSQVNLRTGTPLAIGAAVGGIVGKQLFTMVGALFPDPNTVGAVQALGTGCYHIRHADLYHFQSTHSHLKGKLPRRLYADWVSAWRDVQFPWYWRRTDQPRSSVFLFQHGHESCCTKQLVHHFVQSDYQRRRNDCHRYCAGICLVQTGADGSGRHFGRYSGPHLQSPHGQQSRR